MVIRMKKKIFRVICFGIIFVQLFVSVSYILRKAENGTKIRLAGFYELEADCVDMIMVGSSPVHPYWATSLAYHEYGFTSYPLSSDVQQPSLTSFLVKEGLRTQSPSLVVVETRMFMRTQEEFDSFENIDNSFRAVIDNTKYSWERFQFIDSVVQMNKTTYWFDIIKYHTTWKTTTPKELKYWDYREKSLYDGFCWAPDVKNLDVLVNNKEIQEEIPIPIEQERYLSEIINYIEKSNTEVLFILAPYQITEEQCKMANYMEHFIREAGYEYINFNKLYDEVGVNFDTDFYNSGHMNVLGAEKYTRYLGKLLQEKYNLPDHRGDEEYAQWDVDYEVWKQQAEVTKSQIYQLIDESK